MITETELIGLADNMAAAASQMGTMGYESLISNRCALVHEVHEIFKNFHLNICSKDSII